MGEITGTKVAHDDSIALKGRNNVLGCGKPAANHVSNDVAQPTTK